MNLTKNQRTLFYSFIFILLGIINPEISELRSNVCPDTRSTEFYLSNILVDSYSKAKTFGFRQAIPYKPLREKYPENAGKSKPLSNQSILKVGHRIIADRGPEPAVIVLYRVFFECLHVTKSIISHLPFPISSINYGNSLKIRPPPGL
jgi:hypothetical protein